ncbi:MAG: hypothetical protein KA139_12180 [Rhodobacteraceae bacterium]|nr:hypothetical protein [Paracoccaceae bacterium]
MLKSTVMIGLLALLAQPAMAQILPEGQNWRELPFEVVAGKPLLTVAVNGAKGRMMFDNGTPEMLFFNRDAAALGAGNFAAQGFAASGQKITVNLHDAPQIEIAGLPFAAPAKVTSGDFGFTEVAFGSDFMGFIGAPMVEPWAFLLDYERSLLTILRTGPEGALLVAPPAPAEILAEISFAMAPGEQPTTAGFIGQMPIAVDLDTGDDGTLYLRPETRTRLLAAGLLQTSGDGVTLRTLSLGGAAFADLPLRLVEAGGAQDVRPYPGSDFLRLGAQFFAQHPSLWNFPAGTFTVLRSDAGFLKRR